MDEKEIRERERLRRREERDHAIEHIRLRQIELERQHEIMREIMRARMLQVEREGPPKKWIIGRKQREAEEEKREREKEKIKEKNREAASGSNLKRTKSRKRKCELQSNRIIYNDYDTAVAVAIILGRFRQLGMNIQLYAPVTHAASTMRYLLIALHTTPDQRNANAMVNMFRHFR